jgi:hypothetical protein
MVQDDQIGAIVFHGQFFFNYRINPNFGATFYHVKSYVLILTKNEVGYILGYFFTNSSGHTAMGTTCRYLMIPPQKIAKPVTSPTLSAQ